MLEVIFGVNLKICGDQTKKTLCFVIRDCYNTNKDAMKQKLIGDMGTIWEKVHKPEEHKDSKIGDFFDFQFETLASKKHEETKFEEQT